MATSGNISTITSCSWMNSRRGMKGICLFNQQTWDFMAFHADEMRMMRPSDVKAMSTAMMGNRSVLCTPNRQDEPGLMPVLGHTEDLAIKTWNETQDTLAANVRSTYTLQKKEKNSTK